MPSQNLISTYESQAGTDAAKIRSLPGGVLVHGSVLRHSALDSMHPGQLLWRLAHPSLFGSVSASLTVVWVHAEVVLGSINQCDVDVRRDLFSGIVLTGVRQDPLKTACSQALQYGALEPYRLHLLAAKA